MQKEDGSRWNLFHLLDDGGNEHLAVIGEVRPYIWLSRKHIIYVIFQIRCAFQPNLELPAGAQRSPDLSLVFWGKKNASVTLHLLPQHFNPPMLPAWSNIPPNLQERETKDGHYLYQCAQPFAELGCGPWSNGGQVHSWLRGLLRQQAEGRPLRLWGRASSPPATAMDWQAPVAGARCLSWWAPAQ